MRTTSNASSYGLLHARAERNPHEIALCAPHRTSLHFAELLEHIRRVASILNEVGVHRGERVALVMPNGPEMASALLAASAGSAVAPLNPAYRNRELEFHFREINPNALIISRDLESPARTIARDRGIPVLELAFDERDAAGLFSLVGDRGVPRCTPTRSLEFADPDDLALLLHTSGTTSQPKTVPLTQRNVCTSAADVCRTLRLGPSDRCLNIMPLHHIGGLVDLLLAPLAAGGSSVCTPGFSASQFAAWLHEFQPTWFQGVPAMLREILESSGIRDAQTPYRRLRFVRSVAASLPADVRKGIEEALRCPIVETYGMTEASPLITSTALPPAPQEAGSLGRSVGPDIVILDAAGEPLPPGAVGEIAIRGENVMSGYANDPIANACSFVNGWFKTGDLGYLDEQGLLFLQSRKKEMINRGGEKISPVEIERVLLEHPAVAEAVVFAMPHRSLGEEVAAAVVLKGRRFASPSEIIAFAGERLADFKIPRAVKIADELPRSSTGKVRRFGLAESFGLNDDRAAGREREYVEPRDELERRLVAIWEEILDTRPVGVRDDFFTLGGYSLLGVRMLEAIENETGEVLPTTALSHSVTVEQLARLLRHGIPAGYWSSLAPIRVTGSKPPFFCCHALVGHIVKLRTLSSFLNSDQPFFGLQARGLDGKQPPHESLEEMAAEYIEEIRKVDACGPYYLGGHSFGGFVAYEMARQLKAQGAAIALLVLIDVTGPHPRCSNTDKIVSHVRNLSQLESSRIPAYLSKLAKKELGRMLRRTGLAELPAIQAARSERKQRRLDAMLGPRMRRVTIANIKAMKAYDPGAYDGEVTILRAGIRPPRGYSDRHVGWSGLVPSVTVHELPGDHLTIMEEPNIRVLAEVLETCLNQAQQRASGV